MINTFNDGAKKLAADSVVVFCVDRSRADRCLAESVARKVKHQLVDSFGTGEMCEINIVCVLVTEITKWRKYWVS